MRKLNLIFTALMVMLLLGSILVLQATTSEEEVLKYQKKLQKLGYYDGPLDGIHGDLTQGALKVFQKDNGLPANGNLDAKTKNTIDLKRRLRAQSQVLDHAEIIKMIKDNGFSHPFDLSGSNLSPTVKGNFQHQYKAQTLKGDKVVVDHVTDLMWQYSGSDELLMWEGVQDYVDQMNQKKYAGFSDWRLPTVEELASLLENTDQNDDMFIATVFDGKQTWCWSADKVKKDPDQTLWIVNFDEGQIDQNNIYLDSYIRLVRSMR